MSLMAGVGGSAIVGPRECLIFSDWGEPAVVKLRKRQLKVKWAVTLADRTGRPGPRRWSIAPQADGQMAVIIQYEVRTRAFDLASGLLLWSRPNAEVTRMPETVPAPLQGLGR